MGVHATLHAERRVARGAARLPGVRDVLRPIASMVLRRVTGMELQDYINERLAKPMGWGAWGYCLHRGDFTLPHANGAGSIAVHATDALRFGYCLLRGGKWGDRQLVAADYIA